MTTQKVQVILQSKMPEQYCLCVAKLQRKDKDRNELKKIADRWQTGTAWGFNAIALLNDKPAYIHTPCRIVIDLRKSQAQALLQSMSFPQPPVPTVTIADVLQLEQIQWFDIMAIAAKIIEERTSGTGMHIADVRLVDGSKQTDSTTTEYASLPLALFSKMRGNGCCSPLLFMCLAGNKQNGQVQVTKIKKHSWWQEAGGPKCLAMAGEASRTCGDDADLKDVATLQAFNAAASVDHQPHGDAHGLPARGSSMRNSRIYLKGVLQSTSTN